MLSINLDNESEQYLIEILKKEDITVTQLIKQMLRERAGVQPLESQIEGQTILERMGGLPEHMFNGSKDLSDRDVRKAIIVDRVRQNHESES
ncbi:MAG: hypothetical protein AAFV85_19205 [Cyanobacteria bacterium J06634_6]